MADKGIEMRRFAGMKPAAIATLRQAIETKDTCPDQVVVPVLVAGHEYMVNRGCEGCRKRNKCAGQEWDKLAFCSTHEYPAALARAQGK
jgi:hypothetical protein